MREMRFQVELQTDAEPGSGIGTQMVDDLVPRDHEGRPVLRATHLKGLMRAFISEVASMRGWERRRVVDSVFGRPGAESDDGEAARFRLGDALAKGDAPAVRTITRTSVGDHGVVEPLTLRTVEAIATGSRFHGSAQVFQDDAVVDLVVRLGLLGIDAVGGGRTRGAGACTVSIEGEDRTPGALLMALDAALDAPAVAVAPRAARPRPAGDDSLALLMVILETDGPMLCPERPVVGNVLRSGIAVSASAVQGLVLNRLASHDVSLADQLFRHGSFRAWPLLPCARAGEKAPMRPPVRVSRTHRLSKLPREDGAYDFRDPVIKPYDWRDIASGSPLKSTDGVLLPSDDGLVRLWKGLDVPRIVSAHAVLENPSGESRRNLFTTECLAPMVFAGLLALPRGLSDVVTELFASEPDVTVGKSRSVRGHGRLSIRAADPQAVFRSHDGAGARIFVVQSPVALPDDAAGDIDAAVRSLAEVAGWGRISELHAGASLRFGWNRQHIGKRVGHSNRLRARIVITPGSVLCLDKPLAKPLEQLVRGLGDGREQGFGALLPHPGIAAELHRVNSPLVQIPSKRPTGLAMELRSLSEEGGPSPSQIGHLLACVRLGTAASWLERQAERGSVRARWEPVRGALKELIREKPKEQAMEVLREWQDLTIATMGAGGGRRP